VGPEEPQVTQARCGNIRKRGRLLRPRFIERVAKQLVEFVYIEAGQAEVEPKSGQIGKLRTKQVFVPRGLLVRAIVCQAQASDLGRRQLTRNVHGDFS
jgi:hypothetical protein